MVMNVFRLLLFLAGWFIALPVFSQIDTTVVDSVFKKPAFISPLKVDTILPASKIKRAKNSSGIVKDSARLAIEQMPRTAIRRSAIVPGWGQLTNKRWWKVPIIYGGFVGVYLGVDFNQRLYKQFLGELQYRYNNNGQGSDPELALYKDEQGLIIGKNFYRRNRDFSVLLGVALYTINIIDAYVDAKFFRFDISDKLGFKISPSLLPSTSYAFAAPVPALKIKLSL